MYPSDTAANDIQVQASVCLPAEWKFDTALTPETIDRSVITFALTSLYTLIDSPILAGEYFQTTSVTEGANVARMSVAADAPRDLEISESSVKRLRRLVAEADNLFGPGHYRQYVWLVALSDELELQAGREHHESVDIRQSERLFLDAFRMVESRLFAHEYVHSWNGKFRRPDGPAIPNYQQSMKDDSLRVYEGLTRYLGDFVLRARSGLSTAEVTRDYLAWVASTMDRSMPGRAWRSIGDTAAAFPAFTDAPDAWSAARRQRDYYDEMLLVWLEADMMIRQATDNRRSMDDFCRNFFGGAAGTPAVKGYTRKDLVDALAAVAPLNWEGFFRKRVDSINIRAPLAGIEASGWALTYDENPNAFLTARDQVDDTENFSFSLGFWAKTDGTISDVVPGSPAFEAGIAPSMQLLAIGGRKWSADAAREAITRAKNSEKPIQIIVESADLVRVVDVEYRGGLRFPHLKRIPKAPDLLSQLLLAHMREAHELSR